MTINVCPPSVFVFRSQYWQHDFKISLGWDLAIFRNEHSTASVTSVLLSPIVSSNNPIATKSNASNQNTSNNNINRKYKLPCICVSAVVFTFPFIFKIL